MVGKAYRLADLDGNLAVNTAAGEPAGIRQILPLNADAQDIFRLSEAGEIGNVQRNLRVSIGIAAEIVTVAPELRVFINAVQHDAHTLAPGFLWEEKAFAVPGGAAGQVSGSAGAGAVKRHGDGPVMRYSDGFPGVVPVSF